MADGGRVDRQLHCLEVFKEHISAAAISCYPHHTDQTYGLSSTAAVWALGRR